MQAVEDDFKRLYPGVTVRVRVIDGTEFPSVFLKGGGVKSLAPVAHLDRVHLLQIDGLEGVTDLSELGGVRIEHVNCRGTGVRSLESLRASKVRTIDASGCPIAEVVAWDELRYLGLRDCRGVRDLTPLRGATLAGLDVRGTGVADLSPLTKAERVEAIWHTCRGVHNTVLEAIPGLNFVDDGRTRVGLAHPAH